MQPQHKELASGRWFAMSLAEQLGNVGSDFERALRWREKQKLQLFERAAARTLELLDVTLADDRLRGHRRREIARLRDAVCTELFILKHMTDSARRLQHYFLKMALLARRERERAITK